MEWNWLVVRWQESAKRLVYRAVDFKYSGNTAYHILAVVQAERERRRNNTKTNYEEEKEIVEFLILAGKHF